MKGGFRNIAVSPNYSLLRANAKRMRREPTEAERLLWQVLRGKRFGVKFRRQHVIGDCIADFACISIGLVVEIDGEYHNVPEQEQADNERTAFLQQRGFNVIRFSNEQVLNNIDYVIEQIEKAIGASPDPEAFGSSPNPS